MDDIGAFLSAVAQFVKRNPETAPHVASAAQSGVEAALREAYERAADMEVALVAALSPKLKDSHQIIRGKLAKWKNRTSCRWDWYTDKESK